MRILRLLQLLQLSIRGLRMGGRLARWIVMVCLAILLALATALVTFWRGVPAACDLAAKEWQKKALDNGFPPLWDRKLYYILWVVAFASHILGWVVFCYLTVWLLNGIFFR